jgi:hypothetical protein
MLPKRVMENLGVGGGVGWGWRSLLITPNRHLGWEFQFLIPIVGTPIGSGIPILFLILEILVGFFFEIPISGETENWNSDLQNLEFQ